MGVVTRSLETSLERKGCSREGVGGAVEGLEDAVRGGGGGWRRDAHRVLAETYMNQELVSQLLMPAVSR